VGKRGYCGGLGTSDVRVRFCQTARGGALVADPANDGGGMNRDGKVARRVISLIQSRNYEPQRIE